jgi:hypothetical protein
MYEARETAIDWRRRGCDDDDTAVAGVYARGVITKLKFKEKR